MNIDVRILFANVLQQVDIPLERQFRMMPALHQNLNPARGGKFFQFLINLLERKHVMICILFGAIKGAKFAVDVTDVGVIDIAIDDIGDDVVSAAVVRAGFGEVASAIGQGVTARESGWGGAGPGRSRPGAKVR